MREYPTTEVRTGLGPVLVRFHGHGATVEFGPNGSTGRELPPVELFKVPYRGNLHLDGPAGGWRESNSYSGSVWRCDTHKDPTFEQKKRVRARILAELADWLRSPEARDLERAGASVSLGNEIDRKRAEIERAEQALETLRAELAELESSR